MKAGAWCAAILLAGWLCCGFPAAEASLSASTGAAQLQQAAARAQRDETRGMDFLQSPGLALYLSGVMHRLWPHAHCQRPVATLHVVQDAVADAFTYPDGAIYLTTGLLARTRNEDQLALILSHEIIHYVNRHALAAFNRARSTASLNADGRRSDLTALLAAAEQQADQEGIELMQRSGYCPQRAVAAAFHDIAKKGTGVSPSRPHDPFIDRMRRIRQLLAQRPVAPDCPAEIADGDYTLHIAPALLANARSAIQQGRWQEAAQSIRRYLSARSDDPYAHYLQGEIAYRGAKHRKQAISCYQRAIVLDPSFAPAYRALGYIYFKSGQRLKARSFLETSLSLAPQADENEYIREYLKQCGQ